MDYDYEEHIQRMNKVWARRFISQERRYCLTVFIALLVVAAGIGAIVVRVIELW